MPELPEVETVCSGLRQLLGGCRLSRLDLRRLDLRYPFPPLMKERLEGSVLQDITRRAKYILIHTDAGYTWIIHLGMSGRIHQLAVDEPYGKHDHVVLHLEDGRRIVYNDARRFGFMDLIPTQNLRESPHLKNLGLEPFDPQLTPESLLHLFQRRISPIKTALLDQQFIVGLGNIYVCEALWRCEIHPATPVNQITLEQWKKLLPEIQKTLQEAIESGGSTLRDYRQVTGELGYFQHRFFVYDREAGACQRPQCGGTIERLQQSGRSTFFCPHCQRRK